MRSPVSARTKTYHISIDALFIALYFVLGTFLSLKIPGLVQISFSILPVLLCAFLFGMADAVAVAVIGNFLEQIFDPSPYGFATLLLWLIPGAIHAIIASLGARTANKAKTKKYTLLLILVSIICSDFVLTALNTIAMYLDGYLLGYPVKALHLILPTRLLNVLIRSMIACILVPLLLPPLKKVLARIR